MKPIRIALAGNPNAGKSTLFNALTGGNQRVGNWPGKTVEKKTGHFSHHGHHMEVVDLPGTYSLSSFSPEEEAARDFIIKEKPDAVVNVVDAANLERNLYLSVQILETGAPMILLLNMVDVAVRRGHRIDSAELSRKLGGIPVLSTVANKGVGLEKLKDAVLEFARSKSNGRYLSP